VYLFFIVVFIGVSACSPQPTKTGFLDDYSQLTPSPHVKGAYAYFNPEDTLGHYSKFIIEPVYVVLTPKEEEDIGHDKLKELAEYFRTQIILELGERYSIVKKPGPGVARVRTRRRGHGKTFCERQIRKYLIYCYCRDN
jgi:hypothetical protein